jgi:hypothetical protein
MVMEKLMNSRRNRSIQRPLKRAVQQREKPVNSKRVAYAACRLTILAPASWKVAEQARLLQIICSL